MTTKHQDPPAKKRCRKVAQQQRVDAANGTPDAHGGRIETCHLVMDTIWFLLIMLKPDLLKFYIADEGVRLMQRFVVDRDGMGREIKSFLSTHRTGAMGTSERGVNATDHSEERTGCMEQLLVALKQNDSRRYGGLTVLELERALLWGGLRYHAWDTAVRTAVVTAAGCYYGGLLALNVMAGGYATLELERRYAWHYRQSELRRMRYASALFDDADNVNAALGANELEIKVAQAGKNGDVANFRFSTRTALITIIARLRVDAPDVSSGDLAAEGVAYATKFVATWGDADGHHLMPGALGYTVYLVVDGVRTSRLFGRESWDEVEAVAVGIPVTGLLPLGMRGDFGYPSPYSPPLGRRERERLAKGLRSREQKAKEALVTADARARSDGAATGAVTAVLALCGQRHKMLDEEFAPQLATAQDAVLAACPSLSTTLDDYVEHAKVLAMHDARAQVLGGKLGAVASAVAGLDAGQAAAYDAAVANDNKPEIARLLHDGAVANGNLGAVAGLDAGHAAAYDAAVASGDQVTTARLLRDGAVANGKLGAVASAVSGLDAADKLSLERAHADKQTAEVERLLKVGSSKQMTAAARARRKATGCVLQVTALKEQGMRSEVRTFTAGRDAAKPRFIIDSRAGGGTFGFTRFVLLVTDKHSGAKADDHGNISVPPDYFTIQHPSGSIFKCKFLEIIAAKNVAAACSDEGTAAGGDGEAE